MKGKALFLTFTSVDAQWGGETVVSVPLSQVREIKEHDFSGPVGNNHLRNVRASVTMAGKDNFYWTRESREELVRMANQEV